MNHINRSIWGGTYYVPGTEVSTVLFNPHHILHIRAPGLSEECHISQVTQQGRAEPGFPLGQSDCICMTFGP